MLLGLDILLILIPVYIIFWVFRDISMKILLIVVWYPSLILLLFKYEIPLVGSLQFSAGMLQGKVADLGFYSYLTGIYAFIISLWRIRKKRFVLPLLKIKKKYRYIIFILLLISTLPVLAIHHGGSIRTATPFLVLNLLLLVSYRSRDKLWYLQFVILILMILAGERVDSVMFVPLLLLIKGGEYKYFHYNKFYLLIGGAIFFALLVAVGLTRGGGDLGSLGVLAILSALYSQHTACDVVYIYLTGISYFVENGTAIEVSLNLLFGGLPGTIFSGLQSPYNYTIFLHKYMENPGGGLVYTESILIFGYLGPIIYSLIYGHIIAKVYKSKYKFSKYIYILLLIMHIRLVWYGFLYIIKPLVLLYIALKILKKSKIHKRIKNKSQKHTIASEKV